MLPVGPLKFSEYGDIGECHALTVSGDYLFLTAREGTGPSGSPHGLGSLAQFVEWSTGLADTCPQVLALEEPQNQVAPTF